MSNIPRIIRPFIGHRVPYEILILATGVGLYLLGALLGYYSNIDFLRHWYVVVIIIGFVWVMNVLCWAYDNYERILRSLETSFDVPPHGFKQLVDKHLARVYSDGFALWFLIPFIAVAVSYILLTAYGKFWVPDYVRTEILQKPVMLTYFVSITILASIAGVYGMAKIVQFMFFVRQLSHLPVSLTVLRVRTRTKLNELARFSLLSSLTWNIGLALVTPIFIVVVNFVTASLFAIALGIGISFFAIPQFQLHRDIMEAKEKLYDEVDAAALRLKSNDQVSVISLYLMSDHVEKVVEWPFDTNAVWQQLFSVAIPILAYLVQNSLRIPVR